MLHSGAVLLFFDMKLITKSQKKCYRKFRKQIIGNGYAMMQESVYFKTLRNVRSYESELRFIKHICPQNGKIAMMPLTGVQFGKIDYVNCSGYRNISTEDVIVA